jgi:hypothetical protein
LERVGEITTLMRQARQPVRPQLAGQGGGDGATGTAPAPERTKEDISQEAIGRLVEIAGDESAGPSEAAGIIEDALREADRHGVPLTVGELVALGVALARNLYEAGVSAARAAAVAGPAIQRFGGDAILADAGVSPAEAPALLARLTGVQLADPIAAYLTQIIEQAMQTH